MRVTGSRVYSRPAPVPKMPTGLEELMQGLTREVLRNSPTNVYEFCADHMLKLMEIRDGPAAKRSLSLEEKILRAQEKVRQKAKERRLRYDQMMQLDACKVTEKIYNDTETHNIQPLPLAPVHHERDLTDTSEVGISLEPEHTLKNDDKKCNLEHIKLKVSNINKECNSQNKAQNKEEKNYIPNPKYTEGLENQMSIEKLAKEGAKIIEGLLETDKMVKYANNTHENTTETLKTEDENEFKKEINLHKLEEEILLEKPTETLQYAKDELGLNKDSFEFDVARDNRKIELINNQHIVDDEFIEKINNIEEITVIKDNNSRNNEILGNYNKIDIGERDSKIIKDYDNNSGNTEVLDDSYKNTGNTEVLVDKVNDKIDREDGDSKIIKEYDDNAGNNELLAECDKIYKGNGDSKNVPGPVYDDNKLIKNYINASLVQSNEFSGHLDIDNHSSKNIVNGVNRPFNEESSVCEVLEPFSETISANLKVNDNVNEIVKTHKEPDQATSNKNGNDIEISVIEENQTMAQKISDDPEENSVKYDAEKDYQNIAKHSDNLINEAHQLSNMNLETAAITIQKVFRNFLFRSRASTFEEETNDDSNTLDEAEGNKEDNAYSVINSSLVKDRRPLGIMRMDTVLQTVNEEKSLSLSTDDSSTLSSAATIIQAHVRGFLIRNKLSSNKTSTNYLANCNDPLPVSAENDAGQQKSKTPLNIHIVSDAEHILSRDDSTVISMDLSLDGSPPSSINLHPLGYDKSERRKLKREDAVQSVSPPSNNSGKLSEDVDSVKEILVNDAISNTDENEECKDSGKDDVETKDTMIETPLREYTPEDWDETINDNESNSSHQNTVINIQHKGNSDDMSEKMSSDEMDVVTPFSTTPASTPTFSHTGEFHDVVLPTKVSRGDTSVVREFKNVLVYFLLWNNS